jgi:DNA polymerase-3 subunit alpha
LGTIPTRTRDGAPDAITQFDMYEVEELGGVKLDLLGLRHLDTLMHARSLIYQRHGEWLDFHSFGYDRFRDPAIWGAIARGHTVGIFQLETPDLTRHAQQLQPRNEVDVAALISIVRPGVKDAGLGQIYLDRRAEKIPVEYDHPLMVDITKETYGVLVYQEQLMETAKKLAGFTGAEANALRRALGKKKMADVMGFKEQFITSCLEIDNNPVRALKMAEKIWTSIEAAGRYAFNKSHAVGYALISTWEVWVKHYYPEEFLAALLATDGDNVNRYVREARRMKFEVLPPDINESGRKFTLGPVGSKQIRYGLQSIHGLGAVACKQIDSGRPYRDFSDYLKRGGKKGADKTAAYNLACLGAFDSLATRDQVLDLLERERAKEGLAPSTLENPDKLDVVLARRLSTDHYKIPRPDFSDRKVIYEIEKELCGSYITEDPLASYLTVIRKTCLADPAEMKEFKRGHKFCIGGQLTQIRPVVVQKKGRYYGREMAFLTIQWNELDFEVTAFPGIWADSRDLIHVGDAVGCDVESDARGCHLINIYLLDQLKEEFGAKG